MIFVKLKGLYKTRERSLTSIRVKKKRNFKAFD